MKDIALRDFEFFSRHEDFMRENPKGLGFFIWKPKVLIEELKLLDDGDQLVMIDSGCQLNITESSVRRLHEYLSLSRESGGVFMQLKNGDFGLNDLSDSAWAKSALLDFLDPKHRFRDSGQVQSGIIIIEKTKETTEFANKWMEVCELKNNFYLKSPARNEPQQPEFQAHRWEQAIMSLLVKDTEFTLIRDETYFAPRWETGEDYPIWAMRNRTGGDAFRRNLGDLAYIAAAKLMRNF